MQTWLVYLIIFLEGYVVLASELVLMRQLTPFVGSSTDILAIIIAAVLLPLAVGYHYGGKVADGLSVKEVRRRLAQNFLIAAGVMATGFVYVHLGLVFELLDMLLPANRWLKTALYCGAFAVYPVYLLGQTLPLLSVALPKEKLARTTGRMLFYSTLGSFGGSILSTLVLMAWVGVHNTVTITLCLLTGMVVLLNGRERRGQTFAAVTLTMYILYVNSTPVLRALHIVQNNAYSQVEVRERDNGTRLMNINRSFSSMIGPDDQTHYGYVQFIEKYVIGRLEVGKPKHILVIGAGGFTLGRKDTHNHYTYLDIDPDLKQTAEAYFLNMPLGPNKVFVAESARSYLRRSQERYDVIVVDAYTNRMTVPADLVTEDFFRQVRYHLKPGGVMAANIVTSATFQTAFSRAIDATLREVFPYISRQILYTSENLDTKANVIYVVYNTLPETPKVWRYTDVLNRYFLDY